MIIICYQEKTYYKENRIKVITDRSVENTKALKE